MVLALLAVLCVVACIARLQLDFNGPHVDESDYAFVGRLLLDGGTWPSRTYVFSSDLPLYIIGFAADLGGLTGARIASTLAGVASLLLVFTLYARCMPRPVALIGAGLLALTANHIFVSKFATYDIWCFLLFVASLNLLLLPLTTPQPKGYRSLAAGMTLGLAVLFKYVVVVYAPLICVLLFLVDRKRGIAFGAGVAFILVNYLYVNWAELQVLYEQQLAGVHRSNTLPLDIAWRTLLDLWPLALPAAFAWKARHLLTPIGGGWVAPLALLAIPLIAYHLASGNGIALSKHLIYAQLFIAPLAALGLWHLAHAGWSHALLAALVLCGGFWWQQQEVTQLENAFPDHRSVIEQTLSLVDENTTVLSENPYLMRDAWYPRLGLTQLSDFSSFDNDADGVTTEQDIIDAVWEGKFDLVYLDGRFDPDLAWRLRNEVLPNSYEAIIELPYQTSDRLSWNTTGLLSLYALRDRPARGAL
ncbi:MAG: glycosyltransferase family 39 protein [Pseudomonadota bacterium]